MKNIIIVILLVLPVLSNAQIKKTIIKFHQRRSHAEQDDDNDERDQTTSAAMSVQLWATHSAGSRRMSGSM